MTVPCRATILMTTNNDTKARRIDFDGDTRCFFRASPLRVLSYVLMAFCLLTVSGTASHAKSKTTIYFFWGNGCPHCEREKMFLGELERRYPELEIKSYEVWYDLENAGLFAKMAKSYGKKIEGVPCVFVGDYEPVVGYLSDEVTGKLIEERIVSCISSGCVNPLERMQRPSSAAPGERETVRIPLLGEVDTSKASLPLLTLVIAGMDGFNPCAFFVLFLLLSILLYAHSRKIMLLIGGTFVFFSGFIYFLFMAAWLNVFLLFGQLREITTGAGVVALLIAVINIKDFFFFKKGFSLMIPEKARPKLFERARGLLKKGSLLSMVFGTAVLAVVANTYELLCTAGFPMVYARALTLHHLPAYQYYLYLVFYNLIYVIPLAAIVVTVVITLGTKKMSEWQGQVLKLISGIMMFFLGLVLLTKPALLNNIIISAGLLVTSLVTAGIVILATRRMRSIKSE